MNKFAVHHRLIGKAAQDKISAAKIGVIGIGGLGCSVVQGLVRLGVQNITLIDNDYVELSNLPRQVLFDEEDLQDSKVYAAQNKLHKFSEELNLKTYPERLTEDNGLRLLSEVEIAIDCTDNPESRYVISRLCKGLGIPMIYGGVNKFEGQVGVFNFRGSQAFHEAFPDYEELIKQPNCLDSGVLPFVVQGVANDQVTEAYKIIINDSNVLDNRLLCTSILSRKQRVINLDRSNGQ